MLIDNPKLDATEKVLNYNPIFVNKTKFIWMYVSLYTYVCVNIQITLAISRGNHGKG